MCLYALFKVAKTKQPPVGDNGWRSVTCNSLCKPSMTKTLGCSARGTWFSNLKDVELWGICQRNHLHFEQVSTSFFWTKEAGWLVPKIFQRHLTWRISGLWEETSWDARIFPTSQKVDFCRSSTWERFGNCSNPFRKRPCISRLSFVLWTFDLGWKMIQFDGSFPFLDENKHLVNRHMVLCPICQ